MSEIKNPIQMILALVVAAGFFFCIYSMLTRSFPAENKDALNSLLGVLTTIFTLQMNFFFGSSSASKSKDDTINAIASAAPVAAALATPPINIPNATTVKVDTKDGDINVTKESANEISQTK